MLKTGHSDARRYQHTRWNFGVMVLGTGAWVAGLAFVEPIAVLPVLITSLGGSQLVVGLASAAQQATWVLPHLLAVSMALRRPRKKPLVFYPCLITRLPFLLIAIAFSLSWASTHERALLYLVIAVYAFFFLGEGLSNVSWYDILARSVPPTRRGRLVGGMQVVGGVLAIGSGAVVQRTLSDSSLPFPQNYGRLFVFLTIGMGLATVALALIREPPGDASPREEPAARFIRSIPEMLRRYPLLRRMVPVQLLCGFSAAAAPFYAVHASSRLHLPPSVGGLFIWAATIGAVVAGFVYGYFSDRFGSTRVIRSTACMVVLAPLLALLVPFFARAAGLESGLAYLYGLVFIAHGTIWGGTWMGFGNYILEIAPAALRPSFVALRVVFSLPIAVMPIMGGLICRVVSFEALFLLVAVGGIASVVYAWRLEEPRMA